MNKVIKKIKQEISYKTGKYCMSPEFLSLILTLKCNFRCQSCSIWENEPVQELSEEEWINVFDDLKRNLPSNTFVEINGGEPLVKKELVFRALRELKTHFKTVVLNTNGSLLDEETVKKLEELGLSRVKVSLYSLDQNIHNEMRGTEIAYNGVMRAIDAVKNSKIKLEVGILLTAKNIKSIPLLVKYFKEIKGVTLILQILDEKVESVLSKENPGTVLPEDLWPREEDTIEFFDWLKNDAEARSLFHPRTNFELIRRYYFDPKMALQFRCFAGQHSLVIYPDGETSFCFKRKSVGNLKNNSLSDILRNKAVEERRGIKKCQKYCRLVGCNFSRGFREVLKGKIR